MAVYLNVAGSTVAPAANQIRALAVFKEKSCSPFRVCRDVPPTATVTYRVGTPRLVGTTLFVPITATVQATVLKGCCGAEPLLFPETFLVEFQDVTTLPTTPVTVESLGIETLTPGVSCGNTRCLTVNNSILITLPTAAAAGA